MIRKSLLAMVITTGLIALLNGLVKSQTAKATLDADKDSCSISCPSNTAYCHLNRARYLTTGIHFPTRGCPDEDYSSLASLKGIEKSSVAVGELEKAMASSPDSETRSYILQLLAAAKITLGNSFLAAGRYDDANRSFSDAYNEYVQLSKEITGAEKLASLGGGMIRAGKPVEAIKYLSSLSSSSSTRVYLLAEAYFSLGQREPAAEFYEKWIDLGCKSNPTMILEDENGFGWMLLSSNRPRCEQLPLELRARMELLRHQYKKTQELTGKKLFWSNLVKIFGLIKC